MVKGEKVFNKKKSIIGISISTILSIAMAVALIFGNMYSTLISNVLNAPTTKIINPVEDIYTSDFSNYDELVKYEEAIGQQVESEGIVLLQNNNQTLPLNNNIKKISVFGQDSVDFVYGGSGSGSVSANKTVSLKTALETSGYEMNSTLWDFYSTGDGSSYRKQYKDVTGAGSFAVNEVPLNVYTDDIKSSFADYSDAAVIVLGRSGGESADLPTEVLPTGSRYLQIDQNERNLIKMVTENFDKVILVINSANPMELGSLSDMGIDATIWVGGVGQTGIYAIGEVLNGNVNPSGRLVDTYAYDSTSAPSFVNLGDYTVTNSTGGEDRNDKYLVYSEGIYVGYRYYETRYEDSVLNTNGVGNYDYSTQVQFPFGYGLSYTNFAYDSYTVTENDTSFDISVNVTNTGKVAGKEVVQVYMQSPYTTYDQQNDIEKASVELVGFAKTDVIEPGQSQTLSITVEKESMKTYDANNAKTYILDAGDYYFALGMNAHEALNNILSTKGYSVSDGMTSNGDINFVYTYNVANQDSSTFAASLETGNPITNQFDDTNIQSYDPNFTYLSRSNWTGTWPTTYKNGSWNAPQEFLDNTAFYAADEVVNDANASMPLMDQKPSEYVYLSDLIGVDLSDPRWDTLISELSAKNMTRLVRMGGYATISIDAIGLPSTTDKDGPSGFSSSLIPGRSGMAYPAEVVLASTWNEPLIEEVGKLIGEDSLALEITGWYAPGINIHRSPYSGRNFEYFSEDSFLSGKSAVSIIQGARSKGVISYMKHFALNDQETNRTGGAYFANEQSIREIYLKPFEMAVREGDATAAMSSMNRFGARWAGAHYGLMTETLRNEWGFQGMVITDQASVSAMLYEDMISGLYAGTDMWLNTNANLWSLDSYLSNPTVMTNVADATKHIAYAVANSNAMNGISEDTQVVTIMPWWQKTVWALAALAWAITAFVIGKFLLALKASKQS